jgi:hypothetical protein
MIEHAYRAYEIGEDGHVRGRTDLLQCRNDQAAKEHAMRLVDGHAIELWDGPCRLAKFEPPRLADSARPDKPKPPRNSLVTSVIPIGSNEESRSPKLKVTK